MLNSTLKIYSERTRWYNIRINAYTSQGISLISLHSKIILLLLKINLDLYAICVLYSSIRNG